MFIAILFATALAHGEPVKIGTRCHTWGTRKTCATEHSLVFPILFKTAQDAKDVGQVVGSRYGKRCNPVESTKGHCVPDFHLGQDVKVPTGTPVVSIRDDGVVEEITPINHCLVVNYHWAEGPTRVTQRVKYCHLSRIGYKVGDVIPNAGDVIGESGDVGHANGPHLHLEMEVPQGWMSDWQKSHCIGSPPDAVLQTDYKEVRFDTFDPSCYGWKTAWEAPPKR